jgi:uncharacterized membrane protein
MFSRGKQQQNIKNKTGKDQFQGLPIEVRRYTRVVAKNWCSIIVAKRVKK